MNAIKIQIPSMMQNIRIVESFIDHAKERHEIDDDIYGNIMIAVTESVNNAIKHGNKEDHNKTVNLSMELHDNFIRFWVEDEGEGFDYNNIPDPTAPENVEKLGGRGIFIMRQLADEVRFHKNGSLVELIFYVQPTEAS
ncbi:MAG: ATP-binding protein [Microscillaceae bacterium]|nr:ATP-binding protein [Microscillaceae bacterium]MDW8460839.1 ATP-binding protein [Cytophagales bacterium]